LKVPSYTPMKPAGILLLLPTGMLAVIGAAQSSPGLVSRELKTHISAGLPSYRVAPPQAQESSPILTQSNDPTVLILPKLTVREKRLPRDATDYLMSRRDFKRKMENLYLDSLAEDGPLNVLLNNFTIPLFSPSKAARGRALYQRQEIDRLRRINALSRTVAPEAANRFERELDNTNTTRPAGTR
jgi:hypothetical protein